jgi:phosphohistidine swiveling domain-containing protein
VIAPSIAQDPSRLEQLRTEFEAQLGEAFAVSYPAAGGQAMSSALSSLSAGLAAFGVIALIVSAILTYNTFSMIAIERTREWGVLRSLGTGRAQLFGLVLVEAWLFALIGSAMGLAGGVDRDAPALSEFPTIRRAVIIKQTGRIAVLLFIILPLNIICDLHHIIGCLNSLAVDFISPLGHNWLMAQSVLLGRFVPQSLIALNFLSSYAKRLENTAFGLQRYPTNPFWGHDPSACCFSKQIKLRWLIQKYVKIPQRNASYRPSDLILAILYAIMAGVFIGNFLMGMLLITILNKFKTGFILVTKLTDPSFVPAMINSVGIITEIGGISSHAAIIARELSVPCIIKATRATEILKNNQRIRRILRKTRNSMRFLIIILQKKSDNGKH